MASSSNQHDSSLIKLPIKSFNCNEVKSKMHEILHANLHDKIYESEQCGILAKTIATNIKDTLKTLNYERYKFVVQVLICEERHDSLQMACRSYWDPTSDKFAQSIYINQFLLCVATAFAVFYY